MADYMNGLSADEILAEAERLEEESGINRSSSQESIDRLNQLAKERGVGEDDPSE